MVLKFVIRNLKKRAYLNLIKVIGLSLALCCILFIVLFLKNELSYDSFHENSKRIYRITNTSSKLFASNHFARIPNPGYIPKLAEEFPEIENYVRLSPIRGGMIKLDESYIKMDQGFLCDSTFFDVFDSELLIGDAESVLNEPGSLVISKSFSSRVFGSTSPIGKVLTIPKGQFYPEDVDFTVNGIMKDFPQNSHFHPDFIATPQSESSLNSWAWSYLLLRENSNPDGVVSGFSDFFFTYTGYNPDEIEIEAYLQRITDIHLHSHKLREIEANSNVTIIYTLALAALILLLIALINYANLNMAMAGYSKKYMFISKVLGSSKWMILKTYLYESLIVVIIAIVIGGIIVRISNNSIQNYFTLDLFKGNGAFILLVALFFSIFSILFGIFPVLKKNGIKGVSKSLIVIQYLISISLIITVFVIHRQNNFALRKGLGANQENLVCFDHVHANVQEKFALFKDELLKYNSIESVSAMFEPPGGEANDRFRFTMEGYLSSEGEESENMIGVFPCDYSFPGIFKLNFISGRDFSPKNIDNEGSGEYIINEAAMRLLNYSNPDEIIGKDFALIFHTPAILIPSGKIIGVVEDFHLSSIKKEIEPLVLFKRESMWLINFVVAFREGFTDEAIGDMRSLWGEMFPEYPFQYSYASTLYKEVYSSERLQAKLLSVFTFVAILLCSMGLLGMSLLTTQRRIKEIGIRKVNGAAIYNILLLLNWSFIKWIILSFILAIPLAYYANIKWLENFAYKTKLHWWIFALAGGVAILIALITVTFQSWKAANRNPVEALRNDS